ncbi:hypothetical protein BC938DRAFT_479672 [Jimgerdemannia flammicorona]|uniref:Uncharacterized protein n=1 Tax=Jimgerdemannia flammicorona TaxID=994334 RepID=A0A433QXS9_9FUNG|nr:hypothetical protein BC938DRAFT_479672 [Jimgerdemannia flammicorona]
MSTPTSNPTPTPTPPTQPPDSPAKTPYTSFRPYLRNFVKSRLPPPDSPRGPAPPNSWDEVCLQWCSQRRLDREEGEPPRCKMVCLRRKEAGAGAESAGKAVSNRWNPLDGYYLYVTTRVEESLKHVEVNVVLLAMDVVSFSGGARTNAGRKESTIKRTTFLTFCIPSNPRNAPTSEDEYEIDLGAQVDRTTTEAIRIVKKTFSPTVDLTQRYYRSWTDGTQAAFFGRFVESVCRADAVHLVRENAKKVVEKTWGGGKKGGGGGGGEGGKVRLVGRWIDV